MRTTLTIEDTLVSELKKHAHEAGKPFKQVVNETLLVGLQQKTLRKTKSSAYPLKPASPGAPRPRALAHPAQSAVANRHGG